MEFGTGTRELGTRRELDLIGSGGRFGGTTSRTTQLFAYILILDFDQGGNRTACTDPYAYIENGVVVVNAVTGMGRVPG